MCSAGKMIVAGGSYFSGDCCTARRPSLLLITLSRSEGNGAFILSAPPMNVAQRLSCYQKNNVPVGACWALPHWYDVYSYMNHTMDFQCLNPYDPSCKHPY